MRVLGSAVLIFETIVLALAVPVAIVVGGVEAARAGAVAGVLIVLCLLGTAWITRPVGWVLGSLVQLGALASSPVVPGLGLLGLVFGALWIAALVLGRRVDAARAASADRHGSDDADGRPDDDRPSHGR